MKVVNGDHRGNIWIVCKQWPSRCSMHEDFCSGERTRGAREEQDVRDSPKTGSSGASSAKQTVTSGLAFVKRSLIAVIGSGCSIIDSAEANAVTCGGGHCGRRTAK